MANLFAIKDSVPRAVVEAHLKQAGPISARDLAAKLCVRVQWLLVVLTRLYGYGIVDRVLKDRDDGLCGSGNRKQLYYYFIKAVDTPKGHHHLNALFSSFRPTSGDSL